MFAGVCACVLACACGCLCARVSANAIVRARSSVCARFFLADPDQWAHSFYPCRAAIAQLGKRQTEDLKVPGSITGLGIFGISMMVALAQGSAIAVHVFADGRRPYHLL